MKRNPKDMERQLRTLAAEQAGYFTAAQAKAIGYEYPQQHFHRTRGNWDQVERGIFRLPDFPASPHEDLVRWALWSRDRRGNVQAVVSHETALAVYDISDAMPARIHLTVPSSFRKKPPGGCAMHRAALAPEDVVRREGFLITTVLRTLVDIAVSPSRIEHLDPAIRDAVARGLVTRKSLLDEKNTGMAREAIRDALLRLSERRP